MSKGMWTDEILTVRKLIQGKCDYNSKKVRVRGGELNDGNIVYSRRTEE